MATAILGMSFPTARLIGVDCGIASTRPRCVSSIETTWKPQVTALIWIRWKILMKPKREGINALVRPSGTGCLECLATGGWWLHLRRCAECGHIGCCDNSPSQHASKHNAATGHPIITSFEPGERWFCDYRTEDLFEGPALP